MKQIGIILVITGLVFNFIETAYFGFNSEAMSRPEEICDVISQMIFNSGVVLFVLGMFKKTEIEVSINKSEDE